MRIVKKKKKKWEMKIYKINQIGIKLAPKIDLFYEFERNLKI